MKNIKYKIRKLLEYVDNVTVKNPQNPSPFLSIIRDKFYRDLNFFSFHEYDYHTFLSYLKMLYVGYHCNVQNILEVGAGLTTILFNEYSDKKGAEVTSIDYDFSRVKKFKNGPNEELKNIEKLKGASIYPKEIVNFYEGRHKYYSGVEARKISGHTNELQRFNCKLSSWLKVSSYAKSLAWKSEDLFFDNNKLCFPKEILENYGYKHQKQFLESASREGRAGLVEEALETSQGPWDLVFLDSGELSSMIEWKKIRHNVASGGIVACHDIYFPKSIKNFLVASSLLASPEWTVMAVDDSTVQGILIARKDKE